MAAIATVTGTAIRPGVSKNNRLYTAEAIGRMVTRAQGRLGGDGMPLTMLTHHGADDDSTRIVGRLTSLTHEADGSARYTAVLADTSSAKDIHKLIAGPDPVLRGVSIRGAWLGKVRREEHEGRMVETGDDIELDGLDYTRSPGVDGAGIDSVDPVASQPRESDGAQRVPIRESAPEATVTITEAADEGGPFADPGYQADKKKRYDLGTKAKAKAAWSYINQADNARLYTSAQLKRVKGRIVKALKGFGVTVAAQEGWLIDPAAQVSESLAECWDMPMSSSSLYLSLTNGPTTVTVSSSLLDAHDLDAVGRAAMAGACDALAALDPDMDADIDVPGAEPEDTDDDTDEPGSACPCGCGCAVPHPMAVGSGCPCGCGCDVCQASAPGASESVPVAVDGMTLTAEIRAGLDAVGFFERLAPGTVVTAAMVNEALTPAATEAAPQTPAPETAAEPTTKEEAPMAETTSPAAETTGATTSLDDLGAKLDQLTGALTGFVTAMAPKPVEAAPAAPAPVAEAAPAVEETQEQMIDRLVAEGIAKRLPGAVQASVEQSGPPARKGLVAGVAEAATPAGAAAGLNEYGVPADWPNKPLHQYTAEERNRYFGPAIREHVLQDRFRG